MLPSPALAQSAGFAVNRYEPAERGSDWFWGDSLDLRGHERLAVGAIFDYAVDPLLLAGRGSDQLVGVVEPQLNLHLGASLVLANRVRLSLSAPVLLAQRSAGVQAPQDGTTIQAETGSGLGDARVGVDVRLLGEYGQTLTMALGAQVFLPSGKREAFTSDGLLRLLPRLTLAGDAGGLTYATQLGVLFRAGSVTLGDAAFGHELRLGGSLGLRLSRDRWLLGSELWATTDASGGEGFLSNRSTHVEALVGVHYASTPSLRMGVGVAQGLSGGLGTPSRRVVAYLQGFLPNTTPARPRARPVPSPEPTPRADNGEPAGADDCARSAPAASCSSRDRDDDNTDGDGDGVPDSSDACPLQSGSATNSNAPGCPSGAPPDLDADGIRDAEDACPKRAGPDHHDPVERGCPLARIQGTQIITRNRIEFRPRSAEIRLESIPVLEQVLQLLQERPDVSRVRVEGHTDSRGSRRRNLRLSLERALAVVDWLVTGGIQRVRLESDGLGSRRPVDTNRTAAGRRNNRRVEFHIRGLGGAESRDSDKTLSR